jgi:hypothetical protein
MTRNAPFPPQSFRLYWRARWGMQPTLIAAAVVFGLVAAGLAATPFRTVRAAA